MIACLRPRHVFLFYVLTCSHVLYAGCAQISYVLLCLYAWYPRFSYCICVKRKTLCNYLCSSSFSVSRTWDFGIVNQYSWFQKSCNMTDRGGELNFLKNWYKDRFLYFDKTYDHRILQTDTSIVFNSNMTNQAGAGDVIMSRSRGKLKTLYLYYQSVMATKVTYLDGPVPIKSHDSLITWSSEITWQSKTTISSLSECVWSPNLAILMSFCL